MSDNLLFVKKEANDTIARANDRVCLHSFFISSFCIFFLQMKVLESNWRKSEAEISKMDDLIDFVRQVGVIA
jgi:hypothetical protein